MPWFSCQAQPQPAASSFSMQDSGTPLGFTPALGPHPEAALSTSIPTLTLPAP